jgi:anti-sigma regulatory factor (Ser/Thr protein kinase)
VERRAPLTEAGGDRIRLVLPAEPDYGRIARVAASSLALRLGLTFVEIEDLRIAVDEAIILLLRPEGSGEITLEFTVEPGHLTIDASVDAGATGVPAIDPGALRRFEEIVEDTVDEHAVDVDNARIHLVKRY